MAIYEQIPTCPCGDAYNCIHKIDCCLYSVEFEDGVWSVSVNCAPNPWERTLNWAEYFSALQFAETYENMLNEMEKVAAYG